MAFWSTEKQLNLEQCIFHPSSWIYYAEYFLDNFPSRYSWIWRSLCAYGSCYSSIMASWFSFKQSKTFCLEWALSSLFAVGRTKARRSSSRLHTGTCLCARACVCLCRPHFSCRTPRWWLWRCWWWWLTLDSHNHCKHTHMDRRRYYPLILRPLPHLPTKIQPGWAAFSLLVGVIGKRLG